MNKKGMDYIDWSMSMGIFIVGVFVLFTFLQPGVQRDTNEAVTLSLVEQNVMQEIIYYVHETPLYIERLDDIFGSNQQALIEVEAAGDMIFTAVLPATDVRFEPIQRQAKTITWNCYTTCNNATFTLVGTTDTKEETTTLEVTCTPSSQSEVCAAVLGLTETSAAVSQMKINDLKTKDYTTVKEAWHIPRSKEFAIDIDGTKIIGAAEDPSLKEKVQVQTKKVTSRTTTGARIIQELSIRIW